MVGDILQDRGILGEHGAIVGAQGRHQPERVHFPEIRAVFEHLLGLGIDLDEVGLGTRLIEGDTGRERAGERGEVELHGGVLSFETG